MATKVRCGQAMIELAMGLFALSLVLAALFGFYTYIVGSPEDRTKGGLGLLREVRADAGVAALNSNADTPSSSTRRESFKVEPLAAEYIFGSEKMTLREEAHLPGMRIK